MKKKLTKKQEKTVEQLCKFLVEEYAIIPKWIWSERYEQNGT